MALLSRGPGQTVGTGLGASPNRLGAPLVCPVCSCERQVGDLGVNCVCHSCGAAFPRSAGIQAGLELLRGVPADAAARLSGSEVLEVGDVLALEDPDNRPYIWDLED